MKSLKTTLVDIALEHYSIATEYRDKVAENAAYFGSVYFETLECRELNAKANVHDAVGTAIIGILRFFRCI